MSTARQFYKKQSVRRGSDFRPPLLASALSKLAAIEGCAVKPGGVSWILRKDETYSASTDAIPRFWGEGSPPQTIINPGARSEIARRL